MARQSRFSRSESPSVVPVQTGEWVHHGTVSRRRFLVLTGGLASSAILAACGGLTAAPETPKPAASAASAPSVAPTRAPTTAPAPTMAQPAVATTAPTTAPMSVASAVASSSVVGVASRTAGAQAAGQPLVIEAVDYGFKTMGSIPAGITTVQLKNLGKEDHEAQLVRLNDGVTVDQFMEALKASENSDEPPTIFTFEGGPAEMAPGRTGEVILDLKTGQYMLVCFVSGPDKQSHAAKGMVLPISVTASTATGGTLPAGNGTLALGTNSLTLPETLTAGRSMYRLTVQGAAPHAFFYGRIPMDKTLDDVKASLAEQDSGPPPWFEAAGGMDGLKPGASGVVVLDLAPGKYAAVDVGYGPEPPVGTVFIVR